ncbi:uncharacterized protein DMENIID0001_097860 [Sergentomyia squamirostris]
MIFRRVIFSQFPSIFQNATRSWSAVAAPDLLGSISNITGGEIDPKIVNETLKLNPKLLEYDVQSWERVLTTLKNYGFPSYMLLPLVVNHPLVLRKPSDQIISGLSKWNSSQFGERNIMKLITKYPTLLEINKDEGHIYERIARLQEYAETRKNVWTLLMNSPNVITDRIPAIESKIKYLRDTMKVELADVLKSEVFSKDLVKIRSRHIFLERMGIYKTKGYKDDPSEINKNPKLYQIIDSSDKTFATKIAFATLEEYEVFEELYARELKEAAEESDLSDNDTDDES